MQPSLLLHDLSQASLESDAAFKARLQILEVIGSQLRQDGAQVQVIQPQDVPQVVIMAAEVEGDEASVCAVAASFQGALVWAELRTMQSPEGALWAHMRGLQAALEALTDAGQLKGAQLIVLSSFDHMIALAPQGQMYWLPEMQELSHVLQAAGQVIVKPASADPDHPLQQLARAVLPPTSTDAGQPLLALTRHYLAMRAVEPTADSSPQPSSSPEQKAAATPTSPETNRDFVGSSLASSHDEVTLCPACAEVQADGRLVELAKCGHAFCARCLSQHIAPRVEAGVWPLRCLACPEAICEDDCCALASSRQQLRRMKHLKRDFEKEEAACQAGLGETPGGTGAEPKVPQAPALFPPAGRQHMFKPPPKPVRRPAVPDLKSPLSAKAALSAHINRPVRVEAAGYNPFYNPRYKSTLCAHWQQGNCHKGNKCSFAHGWEELRVHT